MPAQKVQALEWRAAVEAVIAPLVHALRDEGMSNAAIVSLLGEITRRATAGGDQPEPELSPQISYAAATRLISRWRTDPTFSDGGVPRPLPLTGSQSFETLAQAANVGAMDARSALRRLKLISVTAGHVELQADGYVPSRGLTEKLDILGRDGAEFIRTMLHNIKAPPQRAFLQRKTSYDSIGGDGVAGLLTALRQHGTQALMSADALLAQNDRDRKPSAARGRRTRVSFGVYCYSEPVIATSPPRKKRRAVRRRVS